MGSFLSSLIAESRLPYFHLQLRGEIRAPVERVEDIFFTSDNQNGNVESLLRGCQGLLGARKQLHLKMFLIAIAISISATGKKIKKKKRKRRKMSRENVWNGDHQSP